jgi:four helix bundle protein
VEKNQNIVERTFNFALNILKLSGKLDERLSSHRIILNQIIRSGTSIGANIEEAQAAESKADFIHKNNIALKEARETKYWLKLLSASNLEGITELGLLINESDELCRIIAKIVINSRKSI